MLVFLYAVMSIPFSWIGPITRLEISAAFVGWQKCIFAKYANYFTRLCMQKHLHVTAMLYFSSSVVYCMITLHNSPELCCLTYLSQYLYIILVVFVQSVTIFPSNMGVLTVTITYLYAINIRKKQTSLRTKGQLSNILWQGIVPAADM